MSFGGGVLLDEARAYGHFHAGSGFSRTITTCGCFFFTKLKRSPTHRNAASGTAIDLNTRSVFTPFAAQVS